MRKKHLVITAGLLGSLALTGIQTTGQAATLTNRYSFNETFGSTTAADSVSGKNGTLMNAAYFTGIGQVQISSFNLASSDTTGDYIALPVNLVTGYTAITVETWYTPTHNGAAFADWNRIWDFFNDTGHFFCRSGNATYGIGGDITTTSSSQGIFGPTVTGSAENHVVWTSDPVTRLAKLFINGVEVQSVSGYTNTPAQVGLTTNNWLGRSKFGSDPYLSASFNEFRIYSGALNPLEVAASFQSGPEAPSANFGSVTNIDLIASSTLQFGGSQPVTVTAAATLLTNKAVNITGQPGLTYVSSDPTKVSVTTNGIITGVSIGTATVTATYIIGLTTNSDSQLISVVSAPAKLIHRYSFDNELSFDVIDSISSSNGLMVGSAIQSGGLAQLDGLTGTYVQLPSNMLSSATISNDAITFETWASFGVNANWVNLFAFGNTVSGAGGNHVFFTPHSGASDYRLIVSDQQPGWANNGEQGAYATGNLDNQTNVHIVCVLNFARDQASIYVNGVRMAQNTAFARNLSAIINNYSYLGRSTYDDPYLVGSIDEFRIYDGALSPQQIAASAQSAGPSSTNLNPGSYVSMSLQVPSPLLRGWQSVDTAVIANWQFATNVNLTGNIDLVFSSSDTNVATINAAGVITALNNGTTTISVNYQGNVSTQLVTVVDSSATLVHRYDFNATQGNVIADLVGSANGTLSVTNASGITNSVWTGSGLLINTNTTLGSQDTYVALPAGTISVLTNNATFEVWATAYAGDYWARIWDFGSAPGSPNFFLGRGGVFDWYGGSVPHGGFVNGAKTHIVVAYNDAQNQSKVFVNGVQTGISGAGAALTPVANIPDTNVWLGRSLYAADPYAQIEYDEFRIYSGLLTSEQVMANYLQGPNPAGPALAFTVGGGNLNLMWPTNATGYNLKSSALLGAGASWSAVGGTPNVVGSNNVLSVPMSGDASYFRLEK